MILPPLTASTLPMYDYTIALAGVQFRLKLVWADRPACWRIDLYTASGVPLLLGSRCSEGTLLTGRYPDQRMPRGHLVLVDTDGAHAEATLESLGGRHKLLFITPSEVANAAG